MFTFSFGMRYPVLDIPRLTNRSDAMHQIISPAVCLVGQCLNCDATLLPYRKIPSQNARRFYHLCNKEMSEFIGYQISSFYFAIFCKIIQQILLIAFRVFCRPKIPKRTSLSRTQLRMANKLRQKDKKHPVCLGSKMSASPFSGSENTTLIV